MSEWNLRTLKIELAMYGDHKGKHVGVAKFARGQESFVVEIPPDRTAALLDSVADLVCQNAHELARRLREELRTGA